MRLFPKDQELTQGVQAWLVQRRRAATRLKSVPEQIETLQLALEHKDEQATKADEYVAEYTAALAEAQSHGKQARQDLREVAVALEALKQERLLPNNPVPVRLEDAIHLYRQALA